MNKIEELEKKLNIDNLWDLLSFIKQQKEEKIRKEILKELKKIKQKNKRL